MASYHCSVKVLSRSAGRSSVQFSAYISGEKMKDERLGQSFNHTSKEEVCYTEFSFADRVPEQIRTPDKFWNAVEENEKSSNAQVCRTWEIALPKELVIDAFEADSLTEEERAEYDGLSNEQKETFENTWIKEHRMDKNIDWLQDYVKDLMEKDHMPAVQWAIHDKEGNPHAHIMAPTRDIEDNGKWAAKEKKQYKLDENGERIPILNPDGTQKTDSRNRKQWVRETVQVNPWNSKELLKEWRERAATFQNKALEMAHVKERVDHRSYEEQGIERIPTIHEGYQARKMGELSERVQTNNVIRQLNHEYEQQHKLLHDLQKQLNEFLRSFEHVREQIRERIERISRQAIERGNGHAIERDGVHAERDYTAEIEARRARVRESRIDRASRDSERERQRIEASKDAERRELERERTLKRDIYDLDR